MVKSFVAIAQIMNRLYKACVLVIGTSYGAEQDPESKTRTVRQHGMALDRELKNSRKKPQSAVLSLEKTQGRHDNSFQMCERMLQKRNTTNTSGLCRREQ